MMHGQQNVKFYLFNVSIHRINTPGNFLQNLQTIPVDNVCSTHSMSRRNPQSHCGWVTKTLKPLC